MKENSLLNECVEDPRLQASGMTPNFTTARSVIPQCRYAGYSGRTGFTLIELLVVVLIIGILAAIAVPQYQKAVEKSRATEMIALVKTIGRAQELYYSEHGKYVTSTELDKLSIELPDLADKYTLVNPYLAGMTGIQIKKGPFAGAGFMYVTKQQDFYLQSVNATKIMKSNDVICFEPGEWAINNSTKRGQYCTSIMGAILFGGGIYQFFSFSKV